MLWNKILCKKMENIVKQTMKIKVHVKKDRKKKTMKLKSFNFLAI